MKSQITSSHSTLSDPERSKSMTVRFQSLISSKEAALGDMLLLLNINRDAYMGSPLI